MSSGSFKACLHPSEGGRKGCWFVVVRNAGRQLLGNTLSSLVVTPQEVFVSEIPIKVLFSVRPSGRSLHLFTHIFVNQRS